MEHWFVYILFSKNLNKYYVGSTSDVEWRLERHNAGWGKYSKTGIPWEIVLREECSTKTEALKREREIKKKKSRKYIEEIIIKAGGRPDEIGKPR
ncbi:MAG: GIY-YIG nuclease family protein [Ignavibacteriaceae bacterium]|jgi:putative endonuclease